MGLSGAAGGAARALEEILAERFEAQKLRALIAEREQQGQLDRERFEFTKREREQERADREAEKKATSEGAANAADTERRAWQNIAGVANMPGLDPQQAQREMAFSMRDPKLMMEAMKPPPEPKKPASGSFDEYSDPNTPAERKAQIAADRKTYLQADDRPRVDVNVNSGGLNPNQEVNLTEKLAKGWTDATKSTREIDRQFGLMETGLKRFRGGDKNGGSQAVLITFQKILDPASVVRESEYARSAQGLAMLARIEGYMDRLQKGGAGVPDAELAAMVETGRQMKAGMQASTAQQRSRIDAMAKKYKIEPELVFGVEADDGAGGQPPMTPVTPAPAPSGGSLYEQYLKRRGGG